MLKIITLIAAIGFATAGVVPNTARPTVHSLAGRHAVAAGPTTIILVRHAEKADTSRDTPLSTAGEDRATALAEAIGNAGVTAIYATPFRRTQQTVKPLSQRVGVPVTVFDAAALGGDMGKAFINEALSKHRGETIVIAGHSNTVPLMLRALGAEDVQPIPDAEYDNLFIAIVPEQGKARFIHAHYGAR